MSERKTSMEYLSCPSSDGTVSSMLESFGVSKVEGRYPTGVKADTLRAIAEFFVGNSKATKILTADIVKRQSVRGKGSRGRITATPESVLTAVKSGKIDKAELEALLSSMA
jgi:hypothetical protein